MVDTFTPPHGVDFGATMTPSARVSVATFGDGYTQRTPDGLNHIREVHQVSYTGTIADIDAVVTFMRGKNGTEAFYWTSPLGDQLLVVCDLGSLQYKVAGPGYRTVSMTLRQEFDLV